MAKSVVIQLKDVTKMYGSARGVNNVSLTVEKGTIYGFLGPNGAGKTTTISMLVDLLRPTSGVAEVFGLNTIVNGVQIRQKIGYLAGDMALDKALTGWQQLEYFGALRKSYDKKYVTELSKKLECDLDRKIKTLSRGNRQKVGLISALMHRPELLILDEPTSGLDPLIQEQFNEIILEHKKEGKTTFISSHILSEVQELCDHAAFIREGKIIADKPIAEIAKDAPYEVTIVSDDKKLGAILKKLPETHITDEKKNIFSFTYMGEVSKLLKVIHPYKIEDISITKGDLESTFMGYYKD
jgi:ABC-2 type transport system ATP-binding protein